MRKSWNEIRTDAVIFAKEWSDAHYEKGESQSFYNEFFEVFGIMRRKVATFEEPVKRAGKKAPGFIDLFWKGTLLVEQKSAGRDLLKAKEQAFDYFPGIKESDLPRYLLVSDFQNFELYDLYDRGNDRRFKLNELPKHVQAFAFVFGATPREFKDQDPVNIKASELMGRLHDALFASGYKGHQLERFLVRLVFCLFADDTGIFSPRDIFSDFIRDRTREDGSDLGPLLWQLFEVLDTPEGDRQAALDEDLGQFPYVNGELFKERLGMPAFNAKMRKLLLDACDFYWEAISPAIFGSLFQSVMDKKKRRAIGAHYTTEQNIMKVIQPLFLDDLKAEFARINSRKDTGRANALRAYQDKLRAIRCFDPACGCGNFLVLAYRELRTLENLTLVELNANRQFDVTELAKVDVDQFFGIELEEFPARIAEVALWMMDHIMNVRLSDALGGYFPRIPLKAAPKIVTGDALEMPWSGVLDPRRCNYVLGNPPFSGAKTQSRAQRAQVHRIANLGRKKGTLDYVTAWFFKAAQYIQGTNASIGFVATNSITQGDQVAQLWPTVLGQSALCISFAHRTFAWGSEARGKANVHVVIIGLTHKTNAPDRKRLFDYEHLKGNPTETSVTVISPYLFDASGLADPETVVAGATRPLSPRPKMVSGTQPVDFEQYVLNDTQRDALLEIEPGSAAFIKPYVGSDGFINGESSWVLCLQAAQPHELRSLQEIKRRMEVVKAKRTASKRKQTNRIADTPAVFNVTVIPKGDFLVVPKVSSERREYVPIAYLQPPTIPSDLVFVVLRGTPYLFGLLVSRMHMAWLRDIGGRLKSDYRYSIALVYNPFPWPLASEDVQASVANLGATILAVRAKFPNSTLGDLYDATTMPAELRRAHQSLDLAVDRLYRKEPFANDRERVEFLLALYEKQKTPLISAKVKSRRKRALRTA